ncbi:MAG: phosphatidate cytidylyltransferase [Geothrix sp.]|uniref:phosphatidate cytidylyltransferase n=1 Tax=Geothrix sp. TaxID=1962974 RepID=UPI0018512C8A|nr:phosphatidate cytidylyltransferase [Geothrix sp.]NWJ41311.1 phosphatidate cytidylyltransferase [Geothrix sp.]WIL20701.1 MAG: phosphatidate cytidylyltransferase [Geothrix sp.]
MERTTPKVDTKNMTVRVTTALVFGVFFFSLLWFGDQPWAPWTFLAVMAGAIVMGMREMTLIARARGFNPSLVAGVLVAWGFLGHFFLSTGHQDPLPLWLVLGFGAFIIHFGALFFDGKLEEALPSQAITWLGALYLGLGLGLQLKLFTLQGSLPRTGSRLILSLFIITWFGDTAAYFVGSFFGKHKLAPRVSPKKSWEGAFGNLGGNLLGAFLMQVTVCPEWTAVDIVALALLLGTVGQLGDLVESTWKRSAGVKDSNAGGVSIPGHGGMLDRVDSLVFAAPALYAYLHFVKGFN